MRCYSPKFLSLPLVFRRGVGEYDPSYVDDPSFNRPIVLSSSLLRRMPNALCASCRNKSCLAVPSLFVR